MKATSITLLALVLLVLAGCPASEPEEPAAAPPRIDIGHVGHDHQIALFVAALEPDAIAERAGVKLVEKKAREVYDLVEGEQILAELHLKKVGDGSKMPAAMEKGEIDVGLGGIPAVMFFVDKGAPFRILCPLNVDGDMLLARPDFPADDWAAFAKAVRESERPVKVGYKAPVAVARLVLEGALKAEGIPYGEAGVTAGVELVNLRGGGKIVPSLEKGLVDAAVINEPFGSIAVHKGVGKIVSLLSDLPPAGRWKNHPCCCVCATEDAIANHRDALKAFLAVIHHATAWIRENPEGAARLAAEWTKHEPEVELASVPNIVYLSDPGAEYRRGLETWHGIMTEVGQFQGRLKGLPFDDAFELSHDLSLYEEMMDGR